MLDATCAGYDVTVILAAIFDCSMITVARYYPKVYIRSYFTRKIVVSFSNYCLKCEIKSLFPYSKSILVSKFKTTFYRTWTVKSLELDLFVDVIVVRRSSCVWALFQALDTASKAFTLYLRTSRPQRQSHEQKSYINKSRIEPEGGTNHRTAMLTGDYQRNETQSNVLCGSW